MDMLWFAGQSNMEGQTEGTPADCSPVEGVQEYKYQTRSFVSLHHPAGEDVPPNLFGANDGYGSLLPDFCRSYRKVRQVPVIAVHTAKGATTIDDWEPAGQLYQAAVSKLKAALEDASEKPEHLYFVWLQGESDAVRGLSEEEYYQKLMAFKNALKSECGVERFGIIRVGYFTCDGKDEPIIAAQEKLVQDDSDFLMLTRVTGRLSRNPAYLNPTAAGHYNNAAMTIIGTEAGAMLGNYCAAASKDRKNI